MPKQEQEDLGTTQVTLPHAQTVPGTPCFCVLKSPGDTQRFPANMCLLPQKHPSLLPPRGEEREMEHEAAQHEAPLTSTARSPPCTANDPPPAIVCA